MKLFTLIKIFLLSALFVGFGLMVGGQQVLASGAPTMIKDINTFSPNDDPQDITNINEILYYTTPSDPSSGQYNLNKYDAASGQSTVLYSGLPSRAYDLMGANGKVFFLAGTTDTELWSYEGGNMTLLKVLSSSIGAATFVSQSNYNTGENFGGHPAVVGNRIYFAVYNSGLGVYELWKSDGTSGGTVLVKSNGPQNIQNLTKVGNYLYFSSFDGFVTVGLWKSDGTSGGTTMVKNLNINDTIRTPKNFVDFNGVLYFSYDDYSNGEELWKSDGTDAGTVLFKNIRAGNASSSPRNLTVSGSNLFFTANDGTHGEELWRTDGTLVGTILLADANPNQYSTVFYYFTALNGNIYYSANPEHPFNEIWKSDGTASGTHAFLFDGVSKIVATTNGTLYFAHFDPNLLDNDYELWKSNGTATGSMMVKDINLTGSSSPSFLTTVNNNVYFNATDGIHGKTLWKSDGTASGTTMVNYSNNSSYPSSMTTIGNKDYFFADDGIHGTELWKSDGTASGTTMVKDIFPGLDGSDFGFLKAIDNMLYFEATDGENGYGLWKSDGTEAGTVQIKPGAFENTQYVVKLNGFLYFDGWDPVNGLELWKSDGTDEGTSIVKDINPGSNSSIPTYLTVVNNTLFFTADDGVYGTELWKSDGTASGTVMVKDIYVGDGSIPTNLTKVGNELFFEANDDYHGIELWKSDGTEAGTVMVKDINLDGDSVPMYLTAIDNTLYFAASPDINGSKLWKSDGTEAGTVIVKDMYPGGDTSPLGLVNVNGVLFFSANDNVNIDLWKSDGTEAGTTYVKNIDYGSGPTNLIKVNGNLYFTVNDGTNIGTIWKSDGTEAGTQMVGSISENGGSGASGLVVSTDNLFFNANNAVYGYEPWSQSINSNSAPMVTTVLPTFSNGTVSVVAPVVDVDNDLVQYFVDYSLDNGSTWSSSTIKTVSGLGSFSTTTGRIIGISYTGGGNSVTFTWDTVASGLVSVSQAKIKVTPYDGSVYGTSIVSSAFAISNLHYIIPSKLTLSPVRALVNAEPDYLTLKLNSRPSSNVVITPVTSVENILSFNYPSFTFTSDNWDTPQSLVAYAGLASSANATLTFTTTSADSSFNNMSTTASTTVAITILSKTTSTTNSGSSGGSSGGGSSSGGSSSPSTAPTQVLTINQPSVITAPAVQTVQTTSSFISNNTSASLVIPAGTISIPATLEIKAKESGSVPLPQPTEVVVSEPTRPVGDVVFDISLKDNATNANITSFSSSNLQLTINIPTISSSEDITTLGLYYLNETTNQWIRVDNASFNLLSKQVTASLNHLTKFAVFKSTDKVLNTEETKATNLNLIPDDKVQTLSTTTPVTLPKLTTKQLTTYKGKFIKDKNNNSFYIDPKTKKLESVTKDNAIKYLAKTAVGIKNKDLIKINNLTDKKVSIFSKKFSNKVLIAIEDKGTLWYVNKVGRKSEIVSPLELVKSLAAKI